MNVKTILAVAAAVCVLLAAAWMPDLVANRQDSRNENQVMFVSVDGVQLEFDQESSLTTRQTLAMRIHPQDQVEIPGELASRKQEKVEAIAASAAERLFQAGVIFRDPSEFKTLYTYTELVYGLEKKNNIFWTIAIGSPDGMQDLSLIIDDRTGTVCGIQYLGFESKYGWDQMPLILDRFIRQYLTGLGEEFLDVDVDTLVKSAQAAQDGSYLATEMTWQELGYGECTITFFVNENGFYTYFTR